MYETRDYKDIVDLIELAESHYSKIPNMVKINSNKAVFIGDIHGDIEAYMRIKKYINNLSDVYAIFLGDYVDRGFFSLEIIMDLLNQVLNSGGKIITLRGNHETYPINDHYGFRYELLKKLGDKGEMVYRRFNELFSLFPIGCLINSKILAIHGGIPNPPPALKDLEEIPKGDIEALKDPLFQLLWNDPDENVEEWEESPRGPGIYLFGKKPFNFFMKKNNLSLLVRAHLFLKNGYKLFFENKLISIFSPMNYVGNQVDGKILLLNNDDIEVLSIGSL